MKQRNKKIATIIKRINESPISSYKRGYMFFVITLVIIVFYGRYIGFLSSKDVTLLAICACVWLILCLCYVGIIPVVDVVLFKKAVRKLRYPEWDFLNYVVFERPVRNKKVMSNSAVIYLIGQLLRKQGYELESKLLIDKAIELTPALAPMKFEAGRALSGEEERILIEQIELIVKTNLCYRIWSNPLSRFILIVLATIVICLHYLIQLYKIIW